MASQAAFLKTRSDMSVGPETPAPTRLSKLRPARLARLPADLHEATEALPRPEAPLRASHAGGAQSRVDSAAPLLNTS